ncbi:hypothetical protein [Tranquillimonas alkanivorans]|uniref:Uncharacterized protein n=1 Tax=Tranquillimonas alkanivorans TaxID=441119 RepID=A0A1I5V208_9RHOB|nr:hypothetical protein [Tranquillimonas alkanivorans]SFQ01337.1 hypothetical protein SAMN04488047_12616 [Tranquillimonas alkanivorans]
MKLSEETTIAAGEFLVIGRRDDSGDILRDKLGPEDFKSSRLRLSDLCKKVLLVIARRDPLLYDFVAVVQNHKHGGDTRGRVVLDHAQLRAFVNAHYRTAR